MRNSHKYTKYTRHNGNWVLSSHVSAEWRMTNVKTLSWYDAVLNNNSYVSTSTRLAQSKIAKFNSSKLRENLLFVEGDWPKPHTKIH